MEERMRIAFFGKGARAKACLEALLKNGVYVAAVVGSTLQDAVQLDEVRHQFYSCDNRGCIDYAQTSPQQSPELYAPSNPNKGSLFEMMKVNPPDLVILGGYDKIVKKPFLEIPLQGVLNLHGGYLPNYRGASVLNWAIINGEKESGCTVMYVDEGVDTGDIIVQEKFTIEYTDTIREVTQKTLDIFPRLLVKAVKQIENGAVKRIKQDLHEGFWYHKRKPEDSGIDWGSMDTHDVYNWVRAHDRSYAASTYFKEKDKIEKLYITKASETDYDIRGIPGRVWRNDGNGVIVATRKRDNRFNRGLRIERVSWDRQTEIPASEILKSGMQLL